LPAPGPATAVACRRPRTSRGGVLVWMENCDRTEAGSRWPRRPRWPCCDRPSLRCCPGPTGSWLLGGVTMRPVRIIATAVVVAALAVTGCSSRSADQTAAPASSAPSSVTTTQPTTRSTAGSAGTTTTTTTLVTTANTTCAISPRTGPAGSRVTLSCRGFAPSERVDVTFGATVLAAANATAGGAVAASFGVPGDFAGSTIPGRKDTFQAKGRQSGTVASATFTVTG
jgi:hypothetical protein